MNDVDDLELTRIRIKAERSALESKFNFEANTPRHVTIEYEDEILKYVSEGNTKKIIALVSGLKNAQEKLVKRMTKEQKISLIKTPYGVGRFTWYIRAFTQILSNDSDMSKNKFDISKKMALEWLESGLSKDSKTAFSIASRFCQVDVAFKINPPDLSQEDRVKCVLVDWLRYKGKYKNDVGLFEVLKKEIEWAKINNALISFVLQNSQRLGKDISNLIVSKWLDGQKDGVLSLKKMAFSAVAEGGLATVLEVAKKHLNEENFKKFLNPKGLTGFEYGYAGENLLKGCKIETWPEMALNIAKLDQCELWESYGAEPVKLDYLKIALSNSADSFLEDKDALEKKILMKESVMIDKKVKTNKVSL